MKTSILLLAIAPALHAAPILKLTDDGILISNAGIKTLLAYPSTVGADEAPVKAIEKSVTDIAVTLTYKGGGSINVSILGGDITYTTSGLTEETTHLIFTAPIDPDSVKDGKYRFDRKTLDFSAESPGETASVTQAKTFGILPTKGPGLSFTFPVESKHQLIDYRQKSGKNFLWQCSVPVKSGKDAITVQIAGGEPASLIPAAVPE